MGRSVTDRLDEGQAQPPIRGLSTLGWAWTSYEQTDTVMRLFRKDLSTTRQVAVVEWLIDGEPFTERMRFPNGTPCNDMTLMHDAPHFPPAAVASLRALLSMAGPEQEPVDFSDGRVGLLFCHQCGDLYCGAVSASVVVSDSTVEWRDIAYQDGNTEEIGDAEVAAFTLTFERAPYESTITALIEDWTARSEDQRASTSTP
ncbi:hypothetical protein SRABI02_02309 [Plantibacter cousiniae]|nr:hypothetical protein SRABI02_02309 [Plantibacter cousiniae]